MNIYSLLVWYAEFNITKLTYSSKFRSKSRFKITKLDVFLSSKHAMWRNLKHGIHPTRPATSFLMISSSAQYNLLNLMTKISLKIPSNIKFYFVGFEWRSMNPIISEQYKSAVNMRLAISFLYTCNQLVAVAFFVACNAGIDAGIDAGIEGELELLRTRCSGQI